MQSVHTVRQCATDCTIITMVAGSRGSAVSVRGWTADRRMSRARRVTDLSVDDPLGALREGGPAGGRTPHPVLHRPEGSVRPAGVGHRRRHERVRLHPRISTRVTASIFVTSAAGRAPDALASRSSRNSARRFLSPVPVSRFRSAAPRRSSSCHTPTRRIRVTAAFPTARCRCRSAATVIREWADHRAESRAPSARSRRAEDVRLKWRTAADGSPPTSNGSTDPDVLHAAVLPSSACAISGCRRSGPRRSAG